MINDLAGDFKPDWKSDKNGDYFEVDPGYLSLGNIFILELQSNENIVINEIETEGVYLKDNLLSNVSTFFQLLPSQISTVKLPIPCELGKCAV